MIYFFCKQNRQCVLPQEIMDTRFTEAKMEAGESPARSRHCKEWDWFILPLREEISWEGESVADVRARKHAQEVSIFAGIEGVPQMNADGMVQHKQDRIQQATTSKAEWNSGDGSWQMGWNRVLPLDLRKKINVVKTVRSYWQKCQWLLFSLFSAKWNAL